MSTEIAVNGVGAPEEQPESAEDINAKKTVKYDSGAADLEKVTDYAEEKEVISTDDISGVIFYTRSNVIRARVLTGFFLLYRQ